MSVLPNQDGVTPKTADELLASLSPEARKIFEETQKGLLSALQREREAHEAETKKALALEKAQQDIERKRLEESAEYKKLYEATQAELSSLKPKAEAVDTYEKTLTSILTAQVAELPEDFRDVVPEGLSTQQKLDWLAKNKAKFMKPEPFDIGAGQRGTKQNQTVKLTDEERNAAKRLGMSEEDFIKYST